MTTHPRLITSSRIPLARIDSVVSAHLGETRVKGNAQPAAFNRQVAMYLAQEIGGWSKRAIGQFYNNRDHSTVYYAVKRIEYLRETNSEMDSLLSELRRALSDEKEREMAIKPPSSDQDANGLSLAALAQSEAVLNKLADRVASRLSEQLRQVVLAAYSQTGLMVSARDVPSSH
jgi:Tfp pilus assembly protein PilN